MSGKFKNLPKVALVIFGVVVPVAGVAMLLVYLLFFRKKKEAYHSAR
jgi:uncharacterized membrane protein YbaN (DUF454 family)